MEGGSDGKRWGSGRRGRGSAGSARGRAGKILGTGPRGDAQSDAEVRVLALEVERALGHGIRLERRRGAARARVRRHPDWRRATARGANILIGQARLSQRARAGAQLHQHIRASAKFIHFRTRAGRPRARRTTARLFLPRGHPSAPRPFPSRALDPRPGDVVTRRRVDGHFGDCARHRRALARPRDPSPVRARPAPPRSPRSNSVPRRSPVRSLVASARARDEDPPPFLDDDDLTTYADLDATESRLVAAAGGSAVLDASRAFTARINPEAVANARADRSVLEYVRLPAEEYNVLDSNAVTRIAPDTFRVAAGAQKILWLEVEPVGLLKIVRTDDGCEQILLGAEMGDAKAARTGKPPNGIVAAMNASLKDLRMKNRISAVDVDGSVGIKCQIDISGEFTEGPFAAAGSDRLNGILRWCLGAVMPWFLDQLSDDYDDWSAGKPRGRENVNVAAVASEILNGGAKGILPPGIAEVTPTRG